MNPVKDEPVVSAAVSLITSATGLLVAFGVHLTSEQSFALAQFVEVALGVAFLVRSQVTPKAHKAPA